jgi:hypothetical protein
MNAVRRNLRVVAVSAALSLLVLFACSPLPATPFVPQPLVGTMPQAAVPCEACAQATLAAAMTQAENSADIQAAATAEILRANAQATLNAVDATVSAAQTQQQSNANIIAAQVAATAEIVRANAQATLYSSGSTQSAALTQDAIRQTQIADMATTSAQAALMQRNRDELAAGTQTAAANNIATQTQVAAATSQWYADQSRQRAEQRQGPITFLWMWCLPASLVLLAGLILWGFWRWLKIQQANQRILENPVDRLPAPGAKVIDLQQDDSLRDLESDVSDNRYHLTKPDDQVGGWLDEVKRKLLRSDRKDEDDDADN